MSASSAVGKHLEVVDVAQLPLYVSTARPGIPSAEQSPDGMIAVTQTLTTFAGQQWEGDGGQRHHRGDVMTVKNIVIPLEIEYLQDAAKERGISRTKLVRVVIEKVVRDELVPKILDDHDLSYAEPPRQKYRRFRDSR